LSPKPHVKTLAAINGPIGSGDLIF